MTNISSVIELTGNLLNDYLQGLGAPPLVVVSNVLARRETNALVLFVAGIQASPAANAVPTPRGLPLVPPPLYIDLFVLFYANFPENDYAQGLNVISGVLDLFHRNPVMTRATAPSLDPGRIRSAWDTTASRPRGAIQLLETSGSVPPPPVATFRANSLGSLRKVKML